MRRPDEVRRRREVRLVGDAARGVVAHAPRREPRAQVGRQVARRAVVADDDQLRALARRASMSASAAIRYGRSDDGHERVAALARERQRGGVFFDVGEERSERHVRVPPTQ